MARKLVYLLILVMVLAQFTTSVAFAAPERGSDCPPGFMLEMHTHPHEHEHDHQHVGTSADQNGDGSICVKHVTPDESIHVHIDNNLP
ncbi:MAG TPA: hypothetical protein VK897_15615 [Anaerolineales bacterium]|nr:hypothetical protein [Anaerolineales bacterium]